MTVAELIEKLMHFRPDLRVVTNGFDEAGIDDISYVEIRKVIFRDDQERPHSHCGLHDIDEENGVSAVWIN